VQPKQQQEKEYTKGEEKKTNSENLLSFFVVLHFK